MNRFYLMLEISYHEGGLAIEYQDFVFAGVSFRDQKGRTIQITKQRYRFWAGKNNLDSISPTLVCGTKTDTSSGWMLIVGPIKGFYIIKNAVDNAQDYISDFGVYVDDPCQAVDDKHNIFLNL